MKTRSMVVSGPDTTDDTSTEFEYELEELDDALPTSSSSSRRPGLSSSGVKRNVVRLADAAKAVTAAAVAAAHLRRKESERN